jgi:hypothetical protein
VKDPTAGMFSQEYSNPQSLSDLADQVLGNPVGTAPGNGNNTLYFGQVLLVNTQTGQQIPYIIGVSGAYNGVPAAPTNIVAVVVNPAGEVVTRYPVSPAYLASMISKAVPRGP